jgi:hypothetical protein
MTVPGCDGVAPLVVRGGPDSRHAIDWRIWTPSSQSHEARHIVVVAIDGFAAVVFV